MGKVLVKIKKVSRKIKQSMPQARRRELIRKIFNATIFI